MKANKLNMKTNQLLMSAVILAISLNAQANEVIAEQPSVAPQPTTVAPVTVKYDADYMDEGVHVLIPHILPHKIIPSGKILVDIKGVSKATAQMDKALNISMIEAYKANGYDAAGNLAWNSGFHVSQSLAFVGSKDDLIGVNQGYGYASTSSKVSAGIVNVVGGVVGVFVGNKLGGPVGAGALGGSLGTSARSSDQIAKLKPAIFEGAQSIPVNEGDIISIYGVWSDGSSNTGNVIFITNMTGVDNDAVVTRAIMKAQNIAKQ
jgi:hypothetical protein